MKSGLLHLISFIDAIPDLTPVFGYTDDIALIALAAKSLYDVIDEDVKAQARETTASLLD
ncbi:YkvA family protein [Aequoribacter fuscus]|uniref:YkvA family protein n=1 Tax=Aequoribacter fuscus TaxID=2518989 RepID=UPI00399D70AF